MIKKILEKTLKSILAISPCIIVVVLIGIAVAKPISAEQPEAMEGYDLTSLQKLLESGEDKSAGEEPDTKGISDKEYKDGTYYGTGIGYAGQIKVCVIVKDKKIDSIEVIEVEADDAAFVERAKGVIDQVIRTQELDVDTVSGATYSSRGILEAIKNALTGETSDSVAPSTAAEASLPESGSSEYAQPENGYKDGTYYGTAAGYGGNIKVEVVIENGKIKSIGIMEAAGETESYLTMAKALIPNMISKQSPNVDVVSGATYTSNGIISAVKNALEQAKNTSSTESKETESDNTNDKTKSSDEKQTVDYEKPAAYKDGTYTGKSQGFRGMITAKVTIAGGEIKKIQVSGTDDAEYFNKAKNSIIPKIITAQDVSCVDAVSGATYSSNGILNAVKLALKQAAGDKTDTDDKTTPEEESETDDVQGEYKDGSYTGTGKGFYDNTYTTVTVTVSGSKITNIKVTDYYDDTTFMLKAQTLIPKIIELQKVTGVDVVTGATYSSNGILEAVKEALEKAKQ